MQSTGDGANLDRVLGVIRRRGAWGALCVAIAVAGAFAYSRHESKKYTATASIVFNSQVLSQLVAGLQTPLSGQAEQNSSVKLLQVGDMAQRTAALLGGGLTPGQVQSSLSIFEQGETSVVGESSVVDVSATTASPSQAAAIANAYAATFVAEQQRKNRSYFASALPIVRRELAALPAIQRNGSAGAALESRIQALSLLSRLRYGRVEVGQRAAVPLTPSAPNTARNVLVGGFLGLLAGVALMLALERLDGRLEDPEEIARLHGGPLLGVIRGTRGRRHPAAIIESHSLILARMHAYNEGPLRSVVITSASPGPQADRLAWGLAQAAVLGGTRTLLLEMRGACEEGAMAAQDGNALSGPELVRTVPVHDAGAPQAATLDVICLGAPGAGSPVHAPPRPGLAALLEWARSQYELVIIGARPLTTVADAYPVLERADGAVLVADLRHARRASEQELREVMSRSGVRVLGVVADRRSGAGREVAPRAEPVTEHTPLAVSPASGARSPSEA